MRVLALAIALAAVIPVGPAAAATARLIPYPAPDRYRSDFAVVEYTAESAERNVITTSTQPHLTIRDTGAVIAAGDGCTALSPHEVRCEMAGFPVSIVKVDAGDMSDVVTLGGATPIADANGGAGDDELRANEHGGTLSGGDGQDTLTGGSGDDTLRGGADGDALRGERGNDYLTGDLDTGISTPAADLFDGGEGTDTISYAGHGAPIVVDLGDPSTDGARGEGDVVRGIENVTGGRASDVIRGDSGRNRLWGQGGDRRSQDGDRLVGRGGDDELEGSGGADALVGGSGHDKLFAGPGSDRVSGGPGDDFINVHNDRRDLDKAMCGDGDDRVLGPRGRDYVGGDCERIEYFAVHARFPSASARRALVTVSARERICAISVRLDRRTAANRWTELGRGSVRARGGDRAERVVRVRLNRTGRAYLARPGTQLVRVTLGYVDGRCAAGRRFHAGRFVARL